MKIFKLSNDYEVVCNWVKTRNGFKHTASLCRNGSSICETKVCYLNRTWESFEYETVLKQVIDKYFNAKEKVKYLKIAQEGGKKENSSMLKTCSMVAAMGELLCDREDDKIDWKKKFLAKVPGIDFPENFDSLSNEEKQRRLDGAVKCGLGKEM
jgi:hypothetical protein